MYFSGYLENQRKKALAMGGGNAEKNKKKEINIVVAFDNNYCIHAYPLFLSILENSKNFYNFYIFYSDSELSDKNRKLLVEFFEKYPCKLIFKKIEKDIFENLECSVEYLSSAAYYRLIAFDKIPEKRVIYLDLDMIVNCDLKKFYNFDLMSKPLGAIQDYIFGLKGKGNYFNSGILLVDLEKWRTDKYLQKCLDAIMGNSDKLKYPDQDTLNEVFKNNWQHLPLKYNRQKILFDFRSSDFHISSTQYNSLLDNPAIIHYTGRIKPWHFRYVFPDKKYYSKYIKKTSYKDDVNKDFSIRNIGFFVLRWLVYKLKVRRALNKVEGML